MTKVAEIRRRLQELRENGDGYEPFSRMTLRDRHFEVRSLLAHHGMYVSHSVDHWATRETICACYNEKIDIEYTPYYQVHWVYDKRFCKVGNFCYCINMKDLKMIRHRIGDCPHSNYRVEDRNAGKGEFLIVGIY
jgi:hypothetical protein